MCILSIRLTEQVVPLRNTLDHASRHRDREMLPPAAVRGLLTLKLAKPTKVSRIELELQAKATSNYTQGAGPSHTCVTEQYKVHSTSTVIFKAGPMPQVRQRATSTRPRVGFLDGYTGSDAQHGTRLDGVVLTLDLRGSGNDLIPDDLEIDDDRNPQRDLVLVGIPSKALIRTLLRQADHNLLPAVRESTEPQSSPILSQSSLTDIPCGSPTSSVHSIRDFALSRTSSIEEVPEDESGSSDTSADNIAYYGLSRIATSSPSRSPEQCHRGRSHSRFSFGKVVHVFDVVKGRVRSRSPRAGSLPQSDEQERGRPLMKGKGKAQISTHGEEHTLPLIGVAEPSVVDGANDQSGDGWVVFPEGTYTYPIFFTIPNNSPPTVKAEVKRPSAFKSKMTAQKEVIVVCLPKDDELEEVGGLDLQRQWDGQFQYRVQIAGRGFPVGGKIPFQLTIMPLAKIKVHCIMVFLDERTEYFTRAKTQARSDAIRRATLLVIRHNNSNERHSEPILPLVSDEPDAFRKSPFYRFLRPGEDESEVASSLMGPGPWGIRHQLRVPDSCSILHPSNQTKGSNVMVNHTLKIVLRVEREERTIKSGRKKLYDITINSPIQILSCRCTSEWTSLPRYDEALRSEGDPEDTSTCPCRTRHQAKAQTHPHAADTLPVPLERAMSLPTTNSPPSGALGTFPSDSLASRTHLYERLMSGLVSERGEAPPSYERFGVVGV
ncbi:hypothetical protein J3R83DRAFT_2618 [Lanmaoa asiatica]|nr:hypothetical protein J3R83DRAFT_2618 [Lanmaoa asiatica]